MLEWPHGAEQRGRIPSLTLQATLFLMLTARHSEVCKECKSLIRRVHKFTLLLRVQCLLFPV